MHTDARTLEDGSVIEADLCIVGAGAAGISMALEWNRTPYNVVLLEGGGFEADLEMQQLYSGESLGAPYNMPLEYARLHYFGGTTGHWAGWCSPLDPIDFEKRDWVPHSGWPFGKEILEPYYTRSHKYVELEPSDYEVAGFEAREPDRKRIPLDPRIVWTKMWQFSRPTRFGTTYRDTILASENVHLFTHANATEIEANEAVAEIEGIRVQTLSGKSHQVKATHYVLACGSIQNARLLLASNQQAKAGIGNDNDQVGRYFMEHFEMAGAQLLLNEPQTMSLYRSKFGPVRPPSGELALTSEVQREEGILNGTASLSPGTYGKDLVSFFDVMRARRRPWEAIEEGDPEVRRFRPTSDLNEGSTTFRLQSRAEQSPNPHSRVKLSEARDALGMRRADLLWQLNAQDKRSIRVFYEIIGREIGKLGIGRLQLLDWLLEDDHSWPVFLGGGFHHMGTTRMHDDPKQGVLDANGKVHGIANLHIAGASMFTTGGCANPTLTLIALSIRLSDHLKASL